MLASFETKEEEEIERGAEGHLRFSASGKSPELPSSLQSNCQILCWLQIPRLSVDSAKSSALTACSIRDLVRTTLEPTCMVHEYKVFLHIRSVFEWSQSYILILANNPDIRSARLYGQFSLDKTWTLQAGSSVYFVDFHLIVPLSA